jgi:hypothetical protein
MRISGSVEQIGTIYAPTRLNNHARPDPNSDKLQPIAHWKRIEEALLSNNPADNHAVTDLTIVDLPERPL